MNAPTKAADLLPAGQFDEIPLIAIVLSETKVQAERRATYDQRALEELAISIRESGLLQPIVVRPMAKPRGFAKYDLVAGERRYIACDKAGRTHVLARIIPLTDEQVLKAQLVENIHRQKLDTMGEARGFKELLDLGVKADAIGDMIGLSRSYVYARVKLLELAPAVTTALKEGRIDASQALLFARIPTHKLQEQALNTLEKWAYQGHGEKLSFRRTAEILGEKANGILIPLAQVPWRLDDESFFTFGPKTSKGEEVLPLPSCVACPRRSGNDPELLEATGDANVCTDRACHDAKAKQTFERRRKDAEATGKEVLTGEAAAAVMPTNFGTRGYVDLDEECMEDDYDNIEKRPKGDYEAPEVLAWEERAEKWKPRTYRQILGDDVAGLQIQLVQDPKHKNRVRELAPDKDVARLLKAKGIKAHMQRDTRRPEKKPTPADPEKAARQADKEARERAAAELEERIYTETRLRTLKLMHAKWKGPLSRDDLELVVEFFLEERGWPDSMELLYPKRGTPATMSERDLGRLLVSWAVCAAADGYRNNDRPLKAVCKRLKIDLKAIEKEVRAELAPAKDKAAKKSGKAKGKKK